MPETLVSILITLRPPHSLCSVHVDTNARAGKTLLAHRKSKQAEILGGEDDCMTGAGAEKGMQPRRSRSALRQLRIKGYLTVRLNSNPRLLTMTRLLARVQSTPRGERTGRWLPRSRDSQWSWITERAIT